VPVIGQTGFEEISNAFPPSGLLDRSQESDVFRVAILFRTVLQSSAGALKFLSSKQNGLPPEPRCSRARLIPDLAAGPPATEHAVSPDFHLTTHTAKSKCSRTSLVSVKCLQSRHRNRAPGVTVPMGWLAIPSDTNFLQVSLWEARRPSRVCSA